MKTKEQYYERVLENRKLMADSENLRCYCPVTFCDWHGKCKECVALHRIHNDHIPFCLQSIIQDKINALVSAAEMTAIKKEKIPIEYGEYIKERDKE
jgi:hypothetical protein